MTLLAFALAAAYRPEPLSERAPFPWLLAAVFSCAVLVFLVEVLAE